MTTTYSCIDEWSEFTEEHLERFLEFRAKMDNRNDSTLVKLGKQKALVQAVKKDLFEIMFEKDTEEKERMIRVLYESI